MSYTSGHIEGNVIDGGCVYFSWQLAFQDQGANYSRINYQYGWRFISSPTNRQLDNGNIQILLPGGWVTIYDVPGRVRDYPLSGSGPRYYQVLSGWFDIGHNADGNVTWQAQAELAGNVSQFSSALSPGFDLPRIPKLASAMAAPSLSVSGRNITVNFSPPADNGGAAIEEYAVRRAHDAAFTSNVATYWGLSGSPQTLTDLEWNRNYYIRLYARNAIGWTPDGATSSAVTNMTVPDAPSLAPATSITPVSAQVSWTAPTFTGGVGVSITGYDVQRATNATFTTDVDTVADTASPNDLTGLLPATTYYTRVRAKNSAGSGAWSGAQSFTTLPSVFVPNAGGTDWATGIPHMVVNGAWTPVQMMTPNGTNTGWV